MIVFLFTVVPALMMVFGIEMCSAMIRVVMATGELTDLIAGTTTILMGVLFIAVGGIALFGNLFDEATIDLIENL